MQISRPAQDNNSGTFFQPGTLIAGRYEVLRKLGEGGMGAVYLTRMTGLGKQVALKVFASLGDANLRRRFEREAALALEMSHPGAAQVLDVGEHLEAGQKPGAGILFIAMEFIDGDDLSTVLDTRGALSFKDAKAIATAVAQTLAYAHHKGVVHRDIKPPNIRIKRDLAQWQVKVLDFGIARVVDDAATRLTQEGSITGTPRYMAPEQIRNEAVDGRADIYALGLVLYEMLTGRDPFARDTVAQVLWAQMNDALPSISAAQPARINAALDAVLAKACAKLPAERFASAQDFLAALELLGELDLGAAVPVQRRRGSSSSSSGSGSVNNNPGSLSKPTTADTLGASKRRAISVPITFGAAAPRKWWGIGLGMAAVLMAAAALWVSLRGQPPPASAVVIKASSSGRTTATAECVLQGVSTALAAKTTAELAQRAGESRIMMPSVALKQLQTLRLTAEKYPESSRDCILRQMLATSIEQESVIIATNPSLWGQTKSVDELIKLFKTTSLTKNYTASQRDSLLAKVETSFIANLQKDHPGDGAFWRRMYYGLLLICEATPEARQALAVELPGGGQCLSLSP